MLISDYDNKTDGDNIEEEFEFGNDETDKYKELLNSINNNDDENAVIEQKNKINIISTANDEDEEVDIDDI